MTEPKQKTVNDLPIFGRDIEDDWSWDREEEELRESNESDEDQVTRRTIEDQLPSIDADSRYCAASKYQ